MPSTKRNQRAARAARRNWTPFDGICSLSNALHGSAAAVSSQRLARTDLTDWAIQARSALDAIRVGQGEASHVGELLRALNVTIALADAGLGANWTDVIDPARDAMRNLGERHAAHGRWVWRGPEMGAVIALLDLHDAQLADDEMTEAQLLAAVRSVHARIEAGEVEVVALPLHAAAHVAGVAA